MSKCETCPVAGPCVAEGPGWSFACKLAGGTAAERAFVVNRSAIDADAFVHPSTTPALAPPRPEAAPPPPRDWSGWRLAIRLGSLNCFYATEEPGCPCNGFRCHALGRVATAADCLECLSPKSKPNA